MTAMLNQTSVDSAVLNRVGEALANASLQNRGGRLARQVGKLEYTLRAGFTRYILSVGLPWTRAKYVCRPRYRYGWGRNW